jgi:SpoVK/Ycf46/Vps4 family AAA+-type ATPase
MLPDFAQHIKPSASWKQLSLSKTRIETLRGIAASVRRNGVIALFAGESGTGKTLAAEALAHELQTDLYRIDLRAVVSKWVAETEKNLNQLLDSAAQNSAVLLFDEADALFGKRTEIRDSHDRFAGAPPFLERLQSYRALAILSVGKQDSLDPALLKRIPFIVDFP